MISSWGNFAASSAGASGCFMIRVPCGPDSPANSVGSAAKSPAAQRGHNPPGPAGISPPQRGQMAVFGLFIPLVIGINRGLLPAREESSRTQQPKHMPNLGLNVPRLRDRVRDRLAEDFPESLAQSVHCHAGCAFAGAQRGGDFRVRNRSPFGGQILLETLQLVIFSGLEILALQ